MTQVHTESPTLFPFTDDESESDSDVEDPELVAKLISYRAKKRNDGAEQEIAQEGGPERKRQKRVAKKEALVDNRHVAPRRWPEEVTKSGVLPGLSVLEVGKKAIGKIFSVFGWNEPEEEPEANQENPENDEGAASYWGPRRSSSAWRHNWTELESPPVSARPSLATVAEETGGYMELAERNKPREASEDGAGAGTSMHDVEMAELSSRSPPMTDGLSTPAKFGQARASLGPVRGILSPSRGATPDKGSRNVIIAKTPSVRVIPHRKDATKTWDFRDLSEHDCVRYRRQSTTAADQTPDSSPSITVASPSNLDDALSLALHDSPVQNQDQVDGKTPATPPPFPGRGTLSIFSPRTDAAHTLCMLATKPVMDEDNAVRRGRTRLPSVVAPGTRAPASTPLAAPWPVEASPSVAAIKPWRAKGVYVRPVRSTANSPPRVRPIKYFPRFTPRRHLLPKQSVAPVEVPEEKWPYTLDELLGKDRPVDASRLWMKPDPRPVPEPVPKPEAELEPAKDDIVDDDHEEEAGSNAKIAETDEQVLDKAEEQENGEPMESANDVEMEVFEEGKSATAEAEVVTVKQAGTLQTEAPPLEQLPVQDDDIHEIRNENFVVEEEEEGENSEDDQDGSGMEEYEDDGEEDSEQEQSDSEVGELAFNQLQDQDEEEEEEEKDEPHPVAPSVSVTSVISSNSGSSGGEVIEVDSDSEDDESQAVDVDEEEGEDEEDGSVEHSQNMDENSNSSDLEGDEAGDVVNEGPEDEESNQEEMEGDAYEYEEDSENHDRTITPEPQPVRGQQEIIVLDDDEESVGNEPAMPEESDQIQLDHEQDSDSAENDSASVENESNQSVHGSATEDSSGFEVANGMEDDEEEAVREADQLGVTVQIGVFSQEKGTEYVAVTIPDEVIMSLDIASILDQPSNDPSGCDTTQETPTTGSDEIVEAAEVENPDETVVVEEEKGSRAASVQFPEPNTFMAKEEPSQKAEVVVETQAALTDEEQEEARSSVGELPPPGPSTRTRLRSRLTTPEPHQATRPVHPTRIDSASPPSPQPAFPVSTRRRKQSEPVSEPAETRQRADSEASSRSVRITRSRAESNPPLASMSSRRRKHSEPVTEPDRHRADSEISARSVRMTRSRADSEVSSQSVRATRSQADITSTIDVSSRRRKQSELVSEPTTSDPDRGRADNDLPVLFRRRKQSEPVSEPTETVPNRFQTESDASTQPVRMTRRRADQSSSTVPVSTRRRKLSESPVPAPSSPVRATRSRARADGAPPVSPHPVVVSSRSTRRRKPSESVEEEVVVVPPVAARTRSAVVRDGEPTVVTRSRAKKDSK